MAGWKLRKDKTSAELLDGETPNAAEAPNAEVPLTEAAHAEVLPAEAPGMAFEAAGLARTYNLDAPEEPKEPAFLDAVPRSPLLEPEAHFTDLDFDSDSEDFGESLNNGYSEFVYPQSEHSEHSDGPLTLVDYTAPEAATMPQEFSLHGAQIFEMPPPTIEAPTLEMPTPLEMPLPAVEAPSSMTEALSPAIEMAPPASEAAPFVGETPPAFESPLPAEEEDFPLLSQTGRFKTGLASAPDPSFGDIPLVSPFVLDTPPAPAPPAAPPQLVVRVGRLSAPFALAKDVTTIGRPDSALHYYPDVEIELDDAVSRRHAEVVRRGGSYFLVDTGSTNGTLLNGEKLPPQEERLLAYGDRIRLGDRTEITFE